MLCPKCGFSASPSRFKDGCPVCGHEGALDAPGYDGELLPSRAAARGPAAPLPLWMWLLALGILAFASIGLLSALV